MEVTRSTRQQPASYIAGVGNCIPFKKTAGSSQDIRCEYQGDQGKDPKPVVYQVNFICPATMQGNLVATPNYLMVGVAKRRPFVLMTLQAQAQHCQQRSDGDHTRVSCQLLIDAVRANGKSVSDKMSRYHGQVGASYTAYCSPAIIKTPTVFSY